MYTLCDPAEEKKKKQSIVCLVSTLLRVSSSSSLLLILSLTGPDEQMWKHLMMNAGRSVTYAGTAELHAPFVSPRPHLRIRFTRPHTIYKDHKSNEKAQNQKRVRNQSPRNDIKNKTL